ncbi:unnamed protein product [Rotaria sordida]|uniref:CCHC-type domain-containing protein n=1 Tax=Rotaria sordida TaxID=392033 RepID=A0A819RSW8_9BILA|nr:unnamed protein product [Rotaria sordida]CAF4052166.1 unnamed protein product [Rotaria sordida]
MTIDSLGLSLKSEQQKGDLIKNDEDINIDLDGTTTTRNKIHVEVNEKLNDIAGHDLNDQPTRYTDKRNLTTIEMQPNLIEKFNGQGDVEQWLKQVLEKFDSFQLLSSERNNLIPDIITGEALIWYFKQQHHIPTFNSFIQNVLYHYGNKNSEQEQLPSFTSPSKQMKQEATIDYKETIMESLRHQMLVSSLEKLQKFSGRSKQNVSKWVRETQQAMHILKLTDAEKLFLISTCLEVDARDWFFDNSHLFTTWISFTQQLINTFESAGKADISFNRLRHYQQGLTQDVRQYYFEVMKLCKEANPLMDDASKLQYLKDGLKPSLRFDVLLKDPQTPEEFLQYAQRVEELKLLDDKQDVSTCYVEQKFANSPSMNAQNMHIKTQSTNPTYSFRQSKDFKMRDKPNYNNNNSRQMSTETSTTQSQYYNTISKPQYQCYKCGGRDHYIRNCPHFQ